MSSRAIRIGADLALLAGITGCTTLGGNVHGSFACSAPEGSCTPTSVIDDRALAVISGEAASVPAAKPRSAGDVAARLDRLAPPSAARTGERVLRIVFPAYVDDAGRLHETAAVRAVVASGRWRSEAPFTAQAQADVLAALDQAERSEDANGEVDPDAPGAAAVNAARARLDPVRAIRAEVDARLAKARVVGRAAPSAPSASGSAASAPAKAPGPAPASAPPTSTVRAASFPAATDEER